MKLTKLFSIAYSVAIGLIVVNIGCTKEKLDYGFRPPPPPPPPTVNTPPRVYAGNIGVFLPADSAFLSSFAIDAENNIDSYRWRQLSGPSQAIIQTPDSLETKISKLIKGEYSFELTVTDNGNLSGKATSNVLVIDPTNAGVNIKIFKDLYAGCWGGECLLSIESSLIPRNIPIKFFLKSADTSVWMEAVSFIYENRWFIQFGGGDLEESKKWEVMIVY